MKNRAKWRQGGYAAALTALVMGAVVALNLLLGAAEDRWALRLDLSPNRITQFSPQTYALLDDLDQEVRIHLVFQRQDTMAIRTQLEQITARYRAQNEKVIVDLIDPVAEPDRINRYRAKLGGALIERGALIVTDAAEQRVCLVAPEDLYAYVQDAATGAQTPDRFLGEARLTRAVQFVISDRMPKVCFLTDHSEISADACAEFVQLLVSNNVEVNSLSLRDLAELEPGDVLIAVDPRIDMTGGEYEALRAFVDDGGRLLMVRNAQVAEQAMPNLTKFLDYYGMNFVPGTLVEDQAQSERWLYQPNFVTPILSAEHPITMDAGDARLIVPDGRAIVRRAVPQSEWTYTDLLTTSESARIVPTDGAEGSHIIGKQSLALAAEQRGEGGARMVVLGSSYLLEDSELLGSSHNLSFALSAVYWLLGEEEAPDLAGKALADTVLRIPSQLVYLLLSGIVVILIPLGVALAGLLVHLRRRRL